MAKLNGAAIAVLDGCMRKRLVVAPIDVGRDRDSAAPAGGMKTEKIFVMIHPDGRICLEDRDFYRCHLSCKHEMFCPAGLLPTDLVARTETILGFWAGHWSERVDEIHRRVKHTFRNWPGTRVEFEVVVAPDTFGHWVACYADQVVDPARIRAVLVDKEVLDNKEE